MITVRRALALLGLGAITATAFAPVANADVFKDGQNAIYITDQTPSGSIAVTYNDIPRTRKALSNACGLTVIRPSASLPFPATISVGSTNVTVASLPLETIPQCNNGVLEAPRTANFKTADGAVVAVGQTPNTQYTVTYTGVGRVRNVKANPCGFSRLTASPQYPVTGTITVSGSNYNLATVPSQLPPLCRNGILYTPASSPQ